MNRLLLLLPFFISAACAQITPSERIEMSIRPGEVRWVEFPISGETQRFTCRDQEIKIQKTAQKGQVIVVESYFSELKPFKCLLTIDGNPTLEVAFKVENREYPAEQLKVPPKTIKLSAKDQIRADTEQAMLNIIYASSVKELLFQKPFTQPMKSLVTSIYGTKRVYNGTKAGQHLGIDYRAAIGDKIPASNRGKVVYAGDLFYTGWTVIIDHGLDIFTVYGHCSKTLVKEGEIVERGQLIALSGNTGRTSGPHLHWGVKVQGNYIDGFVLIDETKKYLSE